MNVGKLESRMICRRLEREGVIKVRRSLGPHSQVYPCSWDVSVAVLALLFV